MQVQHKKNKRQKPHSGWPHDTNSLNRQGSTWQKNPNEIRCLAAGKRGATNGSNFSSIRRVYKLSQVWILHILAKANPLLLQFAATNCRGGICTSDCTGTRAQLQRVAIHGSHRQFCFTEKQNKHNANCCIRNLHGDFDHLNITQLAQMSMQLGEDPTSYL